MGRNVSTGVAGSGAGLGSVYASGQNTITTAVTNQDIIFDPNGTGTVQFVGGLQLRTNGEMRAYNTANTFYTSVKSLAGLSANTTFQLPSSNGSVGAFLQTDGTGVTSWQAVPTAALTVSDAGSNSNTHYVYFGTSTPTEGSLPTGAQSTMRVDSGLTFIPSENRIVSSIGQHPTVTGSSGASGQLTIQGTTNSTKNTASVLFNDNVTSSSTSTGTVVVTGGVGISGALNVGGSISSNSSTVVTQSSLGTLQPTLGSNAIIRTNANTINETITIPAGTNGMSSGPITIASGQTVTVNGDWSVV
jgi:hypothetical protein